MAEGKDEDKTVLAGRITGILSKPGKDGKKSYELKISLTERPESLDEVDDLVGLDVRIGLTPMQMSM